MKIDLVVQLSELVRKYIVKNFEKVHLSGNLMKTIRVEYQDDKFFVVIPAEIYDVELYLEKKVIKYTGEGSYAQDVNETGGLSGKHINYVDKAIIEAIDEWVKVNNLDVGELEIL